MYVFKKKINIYIKNIYRVLINMCGHLWKIESRHQNKMKKVHIHICPIKLN